MTAALPTAPIVITGAGGRLAGVLIDAVLEAGGTVAAVGRPQSAYALPPGAAGVVYGADLADEASVETVFRRIAEAHGPIGALIHTVGGWDGRPLLETALADWERLLTVNLTTAFLCVREAIRHMGEDGGRIVAIASAQGVERGVAQQAAYSAAKAGVVRLIESVAEEFRPRGIQAFALAPSTILYGNGTDAPPAEGVPAEKLARLCLNLLQVPEARGMSGSVVRAYRP